MKRLLDYQVTGLTEDQTADEIDRILDADPLTAAKIHEDGYGLYVDTKTKRAVFEDNNDKILISTEDMPSYSVIWDGNNGWMVSEQ